MGHLMQRLMVEMAHQSRLEIELKLEMVHQQSRLEVEVVHQTQWSQQRVEMFHPVHHQLKVEMAHQISRGRLNLEEVVRLMHLEIVLLRHQLDAQMVLEEAVPCKRLCSEYQPECTRWESFLLCSSHPGRRSCPEGPESPRAGPGARPGAAGNGGRLGRS